MRGMIVHPWRTARQFRRLLYASMLGLALFAILHNVFEAVTSKAASVGALQSLASWLNGVIIQVGVV